MKRIILFTMLLMLTGGLAGCQNTQNELNDIDIESMASYSVTEETKKEFFEEESGEVCYYYEMEKFFVKDTFANASTINRTLQQIYDEYEAGYMENAEWNDSVSDDFVNIPYDKWHMLGIQYVGNDYISILYNNISYMGGAHAYSWLDGITIDCKTGEQVTASQLLGKSDEDILTQISNTMGLDVVGTWDDLDFYITDSTIVFFYRMPNFWEDVVWELPTED